MEVYKEIFNASSLYDMLFINVTGVLEYPTLNEMATNNVKMANSWFNLTNGDNSNALYQEKAIEYPEFTKIVAISYGNFYFDNGLQRNFKRIVNENEFLLLGTIMSDLNQLSTGSKVMLCGENIISNDIPLLIKRFLIHKANFDGEDQKLPSLLKNYLIAKPWDSSILDTRMVWKFNGLSASPANSQELYSNFLGLKKTVELLSNSDLSKYYWESNDADKMNFIGLQSATKVNLAMQLMNFLREL